MGTNQFRVQVYENAYVSSTAGVNMDKSGLLAAPELSQTSGLRFRTKLPGGFDTCSFTFAGSLIEAVRWKSKFLAQHLDVLSAGQYAFYGVIEDILLDRVNAQVQVTADGYYFTLEDQRYNTVSVTSETMKNAVWWALSQQGAAKDWRGYFMNGAVGDVTGTGTTVQRRVGTSGSETVREAVEGWCAMGDSSNNRYWPAVWDSRNLHVDQESTTTRWFVRVADMNLASFAVSRRDIWNHIIVSYQDVMDGTRKDSTTAQDTTSQQRYGLRQLLYPGGEMNTTAANQLAATLLARLKDPRDRPQIGVDRVHDTGLVERPLWLVRAGDIIEAIDLELPDRPVGEQVTGRNKWLIRETEYDADGNTLTLTPEQQEQSLELTLQQSLDTTRLQASTTATHALLSGTHSDTLAASVVRGDTIVGNSTPVWSRLAIGAANTGLFSDGTDPSWRKAVEADLNLTDVTTADVTSTKHGLAPKSPADATKFLNGAATPAFALVKDSDLSTSDVTTNNATTAKHGFLKKLSNVATEFLDGTGSFSTPAGGGNLVWVATQTVAGSAATTITFSSLDLATDLVYLFVASIKNATAADMGIKGFFNADSPTETGYSSETIRGDGAVASAFNSNNNASIGAIKASAGMLMLLWMCRDPDGYPYVATFTASGLTTANRIDNKTMVKNSTTNVTAFDFYSATASGFAIGTTIWLYALNP